MAITGEKPKKKTHGIFYTPDNVASLLCDWAVKSESDVVLEPSFGGCVFLKATQIRFLQLGVSEDEVFQHLYGSDIDSAAFDHLHKILPYSNGHFIQSDFLKLGLESFPIKQKFSVIIGNPPYVSHHNMLSEQKKTAWEWLENSSFRGQIDKRASLWVYFVLHSLSLIKQAGRIVWVLPASFLFADYANQVRKILEQHFNRILAIVVGSRLFIDDGTEEISIFLLGDGYHLVNSDKCKVSFSFAASSVDVPNIIKAWDDGNLDTQTMSLSNFLPDAALDIYSDLLSSTNIVTLGDLYDVQIGVVSGANDFFILNENDWNKNFLPEEALAYVLTRFRDTSGLTFTKEDLLLLKETGIPCMMLDTSKIETLPLPIQTYLAKFPIKRLDATTFQRRANRVWHHFNDNKIPDAFFPYMNNEGPRIVLNNVKINTTNSVHRLYLKTHPKSKFSVDILQKQAAISILSTFSQLSAELEGRVYGAGVLKHEPSEAKCIKLLLSSDFLLEDLEKAFKKVDQALRIGNVLQARDVADRFVFSNLSESEQIQYKGALLLGLKTMRANRSPKDKGEKNE